MKYNIELTSQKIYDSKNNPLSNIFDKGNHREAYLFTLNMDNRQRSFMIESVNGEIIKDSKEMKSQKENVQGKIEHMNLADTILSNTKLGAMIAEQYMQFVIDDVSKDPLLYEKYNEMINEQNVKPKEALYICSMSKLCPDVDFFQLDAGTYGELVSNYHGNLMVNLYSKKDLEMKAAMMIDAKERNERER